MEKISRAIISVHDKNGIVKLARYLADKGVQIISSGGTQKTLATAGIRTEQVSAITGFPEILDGRVRHYIRLFLPEYWQNVIRIIWLNWKNKRSIRLI